MHRTTFVSILLIVSAYVLQCAAQNTLPWYAVVEHAEVPRYPVLAISARLEGQVHLHVLVKAGIIVSVDSDRTPNLALLIKAATENVKSWRFSPKVNGGFDVTYSFELRKDEGISSENPYIEMRMPESIRLLARPVRRTCSDCPPSD